MKRRLYISVLLIIFSVTSLKAQFVLTPRNFISEEDSSKNYIVVPFKGMSKHDLYIAAKGYFESIFNNPKEVLTCTEDENIVVDYEGDDFSISYGFSWARYAVLYKHKIDFKDGRIRISPFFKYAIQHGGNRNGHIINLNGSNFLGKDAVFGSKSGNLIFKKAKEIAENECTLFVMGCKHPILAAFVWASSFTTFARKTYVCTQRNKCFSGLLHSRGHASGYFSPVPIGTQQ